MASVNKVIIIGNLGADPEVRYLPSGEAVANVRIATTEKWKDKASGEQKEAVEWHRVNFFGRLAEIAGQYLKKGSLAYVEGRLKTRKWKDKDTGADRYATEIAGDRLQMLGGREAREDDAAPAKSEPQKPAVSAPSRGGKHFDDMEDDLPF